MPTQILLPALSPTMEEGKLVTRMENEDDAIRSVTGAGAPIPYAASLEKLVLPTADSVV